MDRNTCNRNSVSKWIIIIPCEVLLQALADGLSLESKLQQVSLNIQKFSSPSDRS